MLEMGSFVFLRGLILKVERLRLFFLLGEKVDFKFLLDKCGERWIYSRKNVERVSGILVSVDY